MTGDPGASVAPLLAQLQDDAQQDVARRLDDARRDAATIREDARARVARRLARALDERRATLALERERQLAAAQVDAGRITLAARERLVERVLAAATDCTRLQCQGEAARAWLSRTLRDALAFLPEGPVILSTDDPHAGAVATEVAPGRSLTVEPLGAPGMRASASDGAVIVDATLERHMRAERSRLAIAIVARVAEPA
jgi:vacuolar-type H+-ATPase subunit E/Vma4